MLAGDIIAEKISRDWKVLIVDDVPDVHEATSFVLRSFSYKDRKLNLISAYSLEEAKRIISQSDDIALVLLDVIMEDNDSGLKLVKYIRNDLKNSITQIVLRTGELGLVPEEEVVEKYAINNFYYKSNLSVEKMYTMIISALRGYELAASLEKVNLRLKNELALKEKKEREIRKLSELQKNILDSTDVWLHVTDLHGKLILWNKAAESISGYTSPMLDNNESVWHMLAFSDDEKKKIFEGEFKALSGGDSDMSDFEAEIKDRWGRKRVLNWHFRPLKEENGTVYGLSCLGLDLTDKKIMEEKFIHSQKMEAVGRLAGRVAHDFNNVLTVIRGYCELLQIKAGKDESILQNIDQIDMAAKKAESFTKQLLSFSRHKLVKTKPFELNTLIRSMGDMFIRLCGENIRLVFDLTEEELIVKASFGRVEQVLMNLLLNSVDALDGKGEIVISTATRMCGNRKKVTLSVKDNGPGIPEDVIQHVFEPYFSTKAAGKGTGLGLSTVYGVAKQCGGSVEITCPNSGGTIVTVLLPDSHCTESLEAFKSSGESGENTAVKPFCSNGKKVAIAFSDTSLMNSLADFLLANCFEVHTIEDITGLDKKSFPSLDFLVADFFMENISGPELYEILALDNFSLKAVYCSDYVGADMPDKSDIHLIIQKPFSFETLLSSLASMVDQTESV